MSIKATVEDSEDGIVFRQFRNNDQVNILTIPVESKTALRKMVVDHLNQEPATPEVAMRSTEKHLFMDFANGVRVHVTWPMLMAALA